MDYCAFTHEGGHAPNCDRLLAKLVDGSLVCVLCDGLNGMPTGDQAATICANAAIKAMEHRKNPYQAILAANEALTKEQKVDCMLKNAGSTICSFSIVHQVVSWANVGDTRIYHFSDGKLMHVTEDDSIVYRTVMHEKGDYESIRENQERTGLLSCLGQTDSLKPHEEKGFTIKQNDALLICTDGFWENIYETEMLIDLAKSEDAKQWLDHMILRIVRRSHLQGDNLTALVYIHH
ncbi:MAG TPA: protein phosphatase 2C domain-containing protein [Bacillota bacterium]|nr:protein phosphatase 2C domain-containing protein [Bacillota bacterium]